MPIRRTSMIEGMSVRPRNTHAYPARPIQREPFDPRDRPSPSLRLGHAARDTMPNEAIAALLRIVVAGHALPRDSGPLKQSI